MKTFGELFGNYIPDLTGELAQGLIEHLSINTQRRELITDLSFVNVLDKSVILAAQTQLRGALQLTQVMIRPHYPADRLALVIWTAWLLRCVRPASTSMVFSTGRRRPLTART